MMVSDFVAHCAEEGLRHVRITWTGEDFPGRVRVTEIGGPHPRASQESLDRVKRGLAVLGVFYGLWIGCRPHGGEIRVSGATVDGKMTATPTRLIFQWTRDRVYQSDPMTGKMIRD